MSNKDDAIEDMINMGMAVDAKDITAEEAIRILQENSNILYATVVNLVAMLQPLVDAHPELFEQEDKEEDDWVVDFKQELKGNKKLH